MGILEILELRAEQRALGLICLHQAGLAVLKQLSAGLALVGEEQEATLPAITGIALLPYMEAAVVALVAVMVAAVAEHMAVLEVNQGYPESTEQIQKTYRISSSVGREKVAVPTQIQLQGIILSMEAAVEAAMEEMEVMAEAE